jgi:hypothetical protein
MATTIAKLTITANDINTVSAMIATMEAGVPKSG